MSGYSQGAESAKVPPVFERDETERDNDQKYRFLMDMPAEQERCISAQGDGTNESLPFRVAPELNQRELVAIRIVCRIQ